MISACVSRPPLPEGDGGHFALCVLAHCLTLVESLYSCFVAFNQCMRHPPDSSNHRHFLRKGIYIMSNTNEAIVEKNYTVKMTSGSQGKVVEDSNTHSRSEIIERAREVLAKQLGLDLSSY